MEFHEKLQELRKQKGLTQEALAQHLYVSRTAISKWESGRGYPNIDSLKAIAQFFDVSIDTLLSGQALLNLAQEDTRQTKIRLCDFIFGALDCCTALFFFLPFFGQASQTGFQSVPLLQLNGIAGYLKAAYMILVSAMTLWGILTLSLQHCQNGFWSQWKRHVSLLLHAGGVLLLIISTQPYAAAFLFLFLIIKTWLLIKKP